MGCDARSDRLSSGHGRRRRPPQRPGSEGYGAAGQLSPLVHDELRRLAAQKLAQERPGQTLQPTALVHEAYLRLVGADVEVR